MKWHVLPKGAKITRLCLVRTHACVSKRTSACRHGGVLLSFFNDADPQFLQLSI